MRRERFDLMKTGLAEEFYCDVGYFIDNQTGNTDDFTPYPYVLKYVELLNELNEEINQLKEENEDLWKKIKILTCYLLSDECSLTDNQLRKIQKELG